MKITFAYTPWPVVLPHVNAYAKVKLTFVA